MEAKEPRSGSLMLHTWMYFVGMTMIILITLWACEVIIFKTAYRRMKEQEILQACDRIADAFDNEEYAGGPVDEKFKTLLYSEVKNAPMKVAVFQYGKDNPDNVIIRIMSDPTPKDDEGHIKTSSFDRNSEFYEKLSASEDGKVMYHLRTVSGDYTLIAGERQKTNDENGDIYFYVSASITQNDMTSDLLANQMISVTIFCAIVSVMVSYLFSKSITRPISEFAATAKKMSSGEKVKFETVGISEYDELATALNASMEETENAEKMRRDFLANVSHDLRTPLTMVKAYAEMIRDISGDRPEKRAEHCKVIIDEVDRLTLLVNDILDLSKLQSGARKPEIVPVNLSAVTKRVIERFAIMTEKGYVLEKKIPSSAMVLCDERMLEQILYNLMGNAFSYTGEDKKVSVRVEKTDGGVKVSVTDTGRGIAPSEKDKVWDRYYRASQTKRAVMGSGIGLSIVKQLFEVNNAQYGIDSVVNRGSTFWFILPSPPEQTAKTDRFRQTKDRPNGENVESKPKRGKKTGKAGNIVAEPGENVSESAAKQPSDPSGDSPANKEK